MEHAAPGRACRRLWCDQGAQTANLFKVETPPRGASPAVDRSSPAKRCLLPERLGDAFLQSPTLRDVMLSAGTFKRARLLVQEDAPFTAARKLLQQPSPTAAAKAQAFASLAAAASSSRRSLDLACQQQQQQQEEQQGAQQQARPLQASPAATPGAPAAQPLPAAPRKRSLEGGRPVAARPLKSFCRRVLPGMGPASAAELQEVRAWLTALEAQ